MEITFIDYDCRCELECWCLPRDLLSDIKKKNCVIKKQKNEAQL